MIRPRDGRLTPIDGPLGTLLDGLVVWAVVWTLYTAGLLLVLRWVG